MLTGFFHPSGPISKLVTQSNFVLEKKVATNAALFIEYSGDFPSHGSPSETLNTAVCIASQKRSKSISTLRLASTAMPQTIIMGVGYSFRLDGLFGARQ